MSARKVEMVFIRMVTAPPLSQYTASVLASVSEAARAATASTAGVDVASYYQRAFLQGGSCELELVLLPSAGLSAATIVASLQYVSSPLSNAANATAVLGVTVRSDPWVFTGLVYVSVPAQGVATPPSAAALPTPAPPTAPAPALPPSPRLPLSSSSALVMPSDTWHWVLVAAGAAVLCLLGIDLRMISV